MDKIKKFVNEHPQWTSWIVLAIGMVIILVWSARDVGLTAGQWTALIVATILVAGLAVWIIGWEDEDEEEEEQVEEKSGKKTDKKKKEQAKPKEKPETDDVIEVSDEEAPVEPELVDEEPAEQEPA